MSAFPEIVETAVIVASICVVVMHLIMNRTQSKKKSEAAPVPQVARASVKNSPRTSSARISVASTRSSVSSSRVSVSSTRDSVSSVPETVRKSVRSTRSSVVADVSERKAAFDARLSTASTVSSMSTDDLVFAENETRTHVLCRHLPNKITEEVFRANVDSIMTNYTHLTVPLDTEKGCNKGYAFVRFSTPQEAMAFMTAVQGMTFTGIAVDGIPIHSRKALQVEFAKAQ